MKNKFLNFNLFLFVILITTPAIAQLGSSSGDDSWRQDFTIQDENRENLQQYQNRVRSQSVVNKAIRNSSSQNNNLNIMPANSSNNVGQNMPNNFMPSNNQNNSQKVEEIKKDLQEGASELKNFTDEGVQKLKNFIGN